MLRTFHGSCHCGAVRFEAEIDLAAGTSRCNCSICRKSRNWNARIKPEAFRLLAGEEALSDYRFNTMQGHHRFCGNCGVHLFTQGFLKEVGGAFVAVQVCTLDDLTEAELAEAPVAFSNGRDDRWWEAPADTRTL